MVVFMEFVAQTVFCKKSNGLGVLHNKIVLTR